MQRPPEKVSTPQQCGTCLWFEVDVVEWLLPTNMLQRTVKWLYLQDSHLHAEQHCMVSSWQACLSNPTVVALLRLCLQP
jgi:hypothetical protein